jgi:pyridoxal biosynthesis lyase PdxS
VNLEKVDLYIPSIIESIIEKARHYNAPLHLLKDILKTKQVNVVSLPAGPVATTN